MGDDFSSFEFLDILTILGFILGLKNYQLNNQQSDALMHEMRDRQDDMLLKIFKQNEILIVQNSEILRKLGGEHHGC